MLQYEILCSTKFFKCCEITEEIKFKKSKHHVNQTLRRSYTKSLLPEPGNNEAEFSLVYETDI